MKYIQHTSENGSMRTYATASKKELHEGIIREANQKRFLCIQEWGNEKTLRYCYATEEQIKLWCGWEKRKTFLAGRNIPIYEIPAAKNKPQDQSYEAVDSQD